MGVCQIGMLMTLGDEDACWFKLMPRFCTYFWSKVTILASISMGASGVSIRLSQCFANLISFSLP